MLERAAEILEVELAVLSRVDGKPGRHDAVAVLHLAAALAHLRIEFVAQYSEQPCLQIGARLETLMLVPGLDQRFLDEVVRPVGILRQRHGKSAQARDRTEQLGLEALGYRRHASVLFLGGFGLFQLAEQLSEAVRHMVRDQLVIILLELARDFGVRPQRVAIPVPMPLFGISHLLF
ncbi:hypothetical protein MPL3365_10105 [Mesorhizobium plurifarium]|uniref:Uncharacterized protein n=1 Tax=Mesorhizobium plurifarium TaxID=69974 RepID=A0A090GS68_MESPL|nr:hypothetical protein MPL3365_10105 [Mesorhizobium plurifarium]